MIELRTLGTAEIRSDSATLTPSQGIVFAAALYVLSERGKPVSRAKLESLIWPDIKHQSRSHRLRQTLLQLKKFGFRLQCDRNTILIDSQDTRSDVDILFGHATGRIDANRSLDFLPGYAPTFSEPFRDWIDAIRNSFQSSAISLLIKELSAARQRGDWRTVDQIASQCLSLDGFNEEAVLAKAESAAMRGSKRKALDILDAYLAELGESAPDLRLPAALLRRRVVERIPERPALPNTDSAFVGRETEVAVLTNDFERARSGDGSATLLVGEPGIGKTRLSAELTRFAELRGARVQRASCRRSDIDRPLSLFVDIVPRLREMPGALGCSPETFSRLKRLTEFELRSDSSSRSVDAQMLFESLRGALFDLLEAITEEHCLVLVIEDLQWLDTASARIIARMIEWSDGRRVFILLNARPNQNVLCEYSEKLRLRTITLAPLTSPDSTALLQSIALRPGDKCEPGFVDWCLAIAEGNPFFLQELAHQWIETGHRYEAPPSVNRVLQERISRLSAEALQVLQTCAILNDYATLDRVERVLEYRSHQLLAAVEELSKAAMLVVPEERTDNAGPQIQPRHDLLSSAAVSRLSPVSLSFLHRRAAVVLEKEFVQQTVSPTLLWACASHRHYAGDRERALSLRVSCAEHLLELGLTRDACITYQETLDYCVTDGERLKVMPRLASAFEIDGEWTRSIEMLRNCTILAAKSDPSNSQHNEFELLMLDARHRSALDFLTLLDETLACVQCDYASPAHRVGAAVLAMKLSIDFGRFDFVDAIYEQVSDFLERSDVSELHALSIQTIYRTERGDRFVPISDLERLVEAARRTEGELGYSRGLFMAATACRLSGRYADGLQFISRALEHATTHRFYSRRLQIMLAAVTLHIAAGAFDKARKGVDEAVAYANSSDSVKDHNELMLLDARIALEEGEYARAAWAFRQTAGISPTYSIARKGYYLAVEVQIRLREGSNIETLSPIVRELEAGHLLLRSGLAQDFEAFSLFLGLKAINADERAYRLLTEYVDVRRRSWPLPDRIAKALDCGSESMSVAGLDSRLRKRQL